MQEPQQPNHQPQGQSSPPMPPPTAIASGTPPPPPTNRLPLIVALVVGLLVISVGGFFLLNNNGKSNNTAGPGTPTALAAGPTVTNMGPTSGPTSTNAPIASTDPPQALGLSPAVSLKNVPPKAPVAVTFSTLMNHAATAAAFKIEPQVEGTLAWVDSDRFSTLVFTPTKGYQPATLYKVSVAATAKAINDKLLTNAAQAQTSFETIALAEVLRAIPAPDSKDIPTDATIAFQFTRPMIPLTTIGNQQDAAGKISFEPALEGRFVWLGTTQLEFQPKSGLSGGTKYTVTVKKDLQDQYGAPLAKDYSYSFTTVAPRVGYVYPTDQKIEGNDASLYGGYRSDRYDTVPAPGSDYVGRVASNAPIVVVFNQAMDRQSVESNFSVTAIGPGSNGSQGGIVGQHLAAPLNQAVSGTFAWGKGVGPAEVMTFTASSPLALDKQYRVTVGSAAKPAGGSIGLEADYSWTFSTYAPLAVADVQFGPDGITIKFNNPVRSDSLTGNWQVQPALAYSSTNSYPNYANDTFSIYSNLDASTNYTLTLNGEILDIAGQKLPTPYTQNGTTPSAIPSVNILGANNTASFNYGQPTNLYVGSVNGAQLNYYLWKLDVLTFIELSSRSSVGRHAETQPGEFNINNLTPARQWSQTLNPRKDKPTVTKLPLSLDGKADRLSPGYYALVVELDKGKYLVESTDEFGAEASLVFVVGNSALTMKAGNDGTLLWAVDQNTGQPAANLRVRVAGVKENAANFFAEGRTDADGLFRAPPDPAGGYQLYAVAEGDNGSDAAAVSSYWSEGVNASDFVFYRWEDEGYSSYNYSNPLNAYIYTERPIYRPGQTVYFKGIVRRDRDVQYSLPSGVTALMTVNNGDYDVFSQTVQLGQNGSFNGQFDLSKTAKLASYQITLKLTDPSQVLAERREQSAYYTFSVTEYRKPEYQVEVKTDKGEYTSGDTISTTATASYFFGGPVANAAMTVRILTADYFFDWSDPKSGEYYDFYDYDAIYNRRQSDTAQTQQQQKLTTDANGTVRISTRADVSNEPTSQSYTIEGAVTDSSNQEVSSNAVVVVHKGQFYIGLRPDDYVAEATKPFSISVVTVKPSGDTLGNQSVKLTLYARTWENTQEKDASGTTQYVYKPIDTQVDQKSVTTGTDGKAAAQFSVTTGGEFIVRAAATDAAGNNLTSATSIYIVPPSGGSQPSWKRDNTSRVDLVADKKLYATGDTAKILVTSPYTSATALLTTERDGIRSTRVFHMAGNTAVLEVPITDTAIPNLYTSLVLVNSLADGADAPSFRLGYTELRVDTKPKQLTVSITPDKQQYEPRQTAKLTIKTTDSTGKGVAAETSLALVDKAIFALAGDNTGNILDNFYGNRSLGVRNASSLNVLRAQNKAYDRYAAAGNTIPGSGGGAKGGGGAGAAGALAVRTDLRDTGFWKGSVQTDANGNAVLEVPLPDNLTTWVVTTKATTVDTLVGQKSSELLVTKPLLARPILPRFLLQGDIAQVGTIVHNYTNQDQQVDVSMTLTGTAFVDTNGVSNSSDGKQQTASQQVSIKAGAEQKLTWTVKASSDKHAGFTIAARSTNNGPSDAVGIDLPINPFITPEVVASAGEVTDSFSQTLFLPYGVDTSVGEMNISLNASLASSALDAVRYTVDYIYACTEQTVSRFLPLLYIEQTYKAANLTSPYSSKLQSIVDNSLARLYVLQHKNGSWGFWEESSYSVGYPYMTAYALEGLIAAKSAGYSVDQSAIDQGVKYLTDKLASTEKGTYAYDNLSDISTRAYVLHVLAAAGEPSAGGQLNQIAENAQDKLTVFGRAHLVLGLVRSGQQQQAAKALQPLIAQAKLQGTATAHWQDPRDNAYYYINMYSDERNTALAVQAILAVNPNDPLASQAVRWLMQNRSEDAHWRSTQETAQATIALAQFVAAKKELLADYRYAVEFNGQALADGQFNQANLSETKKLAVQIKDMLVNQPNALAISRTSGNGPLYYNMNLRYYVPAMGIAAANNGLSVSRVYLPPTSDNDKTNPPRPITTTNAGDLVHVRLTLVVPQDSYYVTVEDYLPAGMEAVNTNLANVSSTAAQASGATTNLCYGELAYYGCRAYDGVEMRDDRVTYFATYLPAGTYSFDYAMRATTPGTYFALPTRAYLLYSPEAWGRSDGGQFTIK